MSYWYQNRQRVDYSEFSPRWHVFAELLRRRPSDTAMVRVMTPVSAEDAPRRAAAPTFAAD